jgi:hypothetical protein
VFKGRDGVQVKTVYFFQGNQYWRYDFDPVTGQVRPGYPLQISGHWPGLFTSDISTGINLGNGKVYLFSGNQYCRYDVGLDRVDPGYPLPIAGNWGHLTDSFPTLDAAVNWGNGKIYFFLGNQYIRWHIGPADPTQGDVDPNYPQPINGGNWGTLPFTSIDAAFNAGNGKAYFFSGTQYARIEVSTHQMDAGYPLPIAGNWDPQFADFSGFGAAEWSLAAPGSTVTAPVGRSGCLNQAEPAGTKHLGESFSMQAALVGGSHPAVCACAEYRQFVRGDFIVTGTRITHLMRRADGGPQDMLTRPAVGAVDDNFREDGVNAPPGFSYGHRDLFANIPADSYLPDRGTGCAYSGTDFPSLGNVPVGTPFSISLDFIGRVVDKCTDDAVIATTSWSVNCSGNA